MFGVPPPHSDPGKSRLWNRGWCYIYILRHCLCIYLLNNRLEPASMKVAANLSFVIINCDACMYVNSHKMQCQQRTSSVMTWPSTASNVTVLTTYRPYTQCQIVITAILQSAVRNVKTIQMFCILESFCYLQDSCMLQGWPGWRNSCICGRSQMVPCQNTTSSTDGNAVLYDWCTYARQFITHSANTSPVIPISGWKAFPTYALPRKFKYCDILHYLLQMPSLFLPVRSQSKTLFKYTEFTNWPIKSGVCREVRLVD